MDTGPMTTPEISVVIPVRDAAGTIARQLDAVCSQDCSGHFEVVVVDNGSTDGTGRVVRDVAERLPSVRLVAGPQTPNRSAARNLGADLARGETLVFCDADDVVMSGWLSELVGAMHGNDVVTGSLVRSGHLEQVEAEDLGPRQRTRFRGLDCLSAGNFAIRKSTFRSVGGFSESFLHRVDVELACRLAIRGIEIAYAPDAVVVYRRRPNLRKELKQHYRWAIADVQLQAEYGSQIQFAYSWKNSVKHWVLVGPSIVTAAVRREGVGPALATLATLVGRVAGSVRFRKWAI